MVSATIDPQGHADRDDQLRKQITIINRVLLGVVFALLISPVVQHFFYATQYPTLSSISLANVMAVGPTDLCAGDPLVVAYDFHAGGAGVLVRDATVWRVDPPRTVVFSVSRRFILEGPIDQTLTETWHVPPSYTNPETETTEPLPPGQYKRVMAISSPNDRILIAIAAVPFSIRDDCP